MLNVYEYTILSYFCSSKLSEIFFSFLIYVELKKIKKLQIPVAMSFCYIWGEGMVTESEDLVTESGSGILCESTPDYVLRLMYLPCGKESSSATDPGRRELEPWRLKRSRA